MPTLPIRATAFAALLVAAAAIVPGAPARADIATSNGAPPNGAVARSAAVPADFVRLVDDTGLLSVSVPPAWADVDTAPGTNDDGTIMPWISASTDFASYRETFDVPGTVFIAVSYTTDLQSWIDRLGQPGGCETSSPEPFDDGTLQGLSTKYERCGTSREATFLLIAANRGSDTSHTYVLQLQAASPADLAAFGPILASVSVTDPAATETNDAADAAPAPAAPEAATRPVVVTLPDGTPIVPATAPGTETAPAPASGDPFTPTNSLAEGAVQITDDTRTITVAVPPDWTEPATAPATDSAGGSLPQIVASPSLAGFTSVDFATPGVRFTARPFVADTAAAVTAAAAGLPCTPGAVQPYSDPVFSGHILQLTDCGGTATRIYLIEANPADQSLTASLMVQVTDSDDSDLQTVLSSFDIAAADQSAAPTSTVLPTLPPTTTAASTIAAAPTSLAATLPSTTAPAAGTALPPTTIAVPTSTAGPVTSGSVFTPPTGFPADTISIGDDTGLLRLGVPPAWTDHYTAPLTGADGTTLPQIAASPNLDEFLPDPASGPDPFTTSGVVYIALPYSADTSGLLAQLPDGAACTPGPVQQYADSVFRGHIQEFTACGGTQTRLFLIVANPDDNSFTAALTVQVTDDPAALDTVLATFNYDPAAAVPGEAGTVTTTAG